MLVPSILRNNKILNGFSIRINQKEIVATAEEQTLKSNSPLFDTISYSYGDSSFRYQIITRFDPGIEYTIVRNCCDHFDIIESKNIERFVSLFHDYDKNFNTIQKEFLDKVSVSFMMDSGQLQDSIYGVFSDGAAFSFAIILDTIPSNYYFPPKGFYWNNASRVVIGKPKIPIPIHDSVNTRVSDYPYFEDDYEVYDGINFRFFGETKILIIYHREAKEIELLIIE